MGGSCSCISSRTVAQVAVEAQTQVQHQQQIQQVETQRPCSALDEDDRPRASSKSADVLGQWKTGAVNNVAAKVEHFVSD